MFICYAKTRRFKWGKLKVEKQAFVFFFEGLNEKQKLEVAEMSTANLRSCHMTAYLCHEVTSRFREKRLAALPAHWILVR